MIKEIHTVAPYIGSLNTNVPYRYRPEGESLQFTGLARFPHENRDLMENLAWEYRAIGYTGLGGRFRRRSVAEQELFSARCAQSGLRVNPPIKTHENVVMFPFLHGAQTLNQYLQGPDTTGHKQQTIVDLMTDLQKAHASGAIYGDRWAGNMLIHPKFGLIHIDFDIELTGSTAKELDAAQVIYHTLWSAKQDNDPNLNLAIPIIWGVLKTTSGRWLNIPTCLKYVRGLSTFLNDTKVGSMEETVSYFIELGRASGITK